MYSVLGHQNKTKKYVGVSLLTALAIVFAGLRIPIPFPILPYLKFDITEIPIFIVLIFYGFKYSVISSVLYWIILLNIGDFTPIGPTMKFLAILSTLTGYTIGYKVSRSNIVGLVCSAIVRVIVMSIMNYIVLVILMPGGIDWAASFISKILGLNLVSYYEKFLLVLTFTMIFNILHTIITIVPSNYISSILIRRLKLIVKS